METKQTKKEYESCPRCGSRVAEELSFCPECGARIKPAHAAHAAPATDSARAAHAAPTEPAARVTDSTRPAQTTRATDAARPAHFSSRIAEPASSADAAAVALDKQRRRSRWRFILFVLAAAIIAVVAFLVWRVFFAPYDLDERTFSDQGVLTALAAYDTDNDNKLSRDEASLITELEIEGAQSVSHLGTYLPNLASLTITSDQCETVDVTDIPTLTELDLSESPATTEIQLGDKPALTLLDAAHTQVESLDISQAPVLNALNLAGVPLTEIDVRSNTELTSLDLADSAVGTVSVAHLANLASLNLNGTDVFAVDLSGCSALSQFQCENAVAVKGLSDTPLSERWVMVDFASDVPKYGDVSGFKTHATATYDDYNRVVETTYEESAVEGDSQEAYTSVYAYDDAGRLVSASTTSGLHETGAEAYEDEGANEETFGEAASSTETSSTDESARLSAEQSPSEAWTFEYDSAGHLVKAVEAGESACEYSYDQDGYLMSFKAGSRVEGGTQDTTASQKITYTYDDAGRIEKIADGINNTETTYSYQGENTLPSSMSLRVDGRTFETTYTYDDQGHVIKSSFGYSDKKAGYVNETYAYDTQGRMTGATRINNNVRVEEDEDSTWDYTYRDYASAVFSYDEKGNLTKVELERANASNGVSDTYTMQYRRLFVAKGNQPVGTLRSTSYPFDCTVESFWAPWELASTATAYNPFTAPFMLIGTNNPLSSTQ